MAEVFGAGAIRYHDGKF
jgi:beta-xylosidase